MTWSRLKSFIDNSSGFFVVCFFSHEKMNLVGFRVETMVLSETFA